MILVGSKEEMAGRLRGRVARAPEVTVVTVGDTAVGKTALIQRFCNDAFPQVRR